MSSYFASDPTQMRLSVSAVVWRDQPGGELLLMQRSDNGHWGLPGGYVEPGESVASAAAREVLEETGVRIELGRLVGVYSDPARQVIEYGDGAACTRSTCVSKRARVGSGDATTPDETLAAGYFARDALPEPFVPIHEIRIEDAARPAAPSARVR